MTRETRKFNVILLGVVIGLACTVSLRVDTSWAEVSQFKKAFHTIAFGREDKNVEVLNWSYGTSTRPSAHADSAYLSTGHIPQGDHISGELPVGDSLYVKWRVISTGKVYEEKVALQSLLTTQMEDKVITFSVKGRQLTVYLIEGIDTAHMHAKGEPDCPAWAYSMFKCTTLYPEHWANF